MVACRAVLMLIFIVNIIGEVVAQVNNCEQETTQCVSAGNPCGVASSAGFQQICDSTSSYCDTTTKTCIAYVNGSPCTTSCGSPGIVAQFDQAGLFCNATQGGSACYDKNLVAVGGTPCSAASSQCSIGSYCTTNKCLAYQLMGQPCGGTNGLCAPWMYCDTSIPATPTCQSLYSVVTGRPCAFHDQCQIGLYCSNGGLCTAVPTTNSIGASCGKPADCTTSPDFLSCDCQAYVPALPVTTGICTSTLPPAVCDTAITGLVDCIQATPLAFEGCIVAYCEVQNCITVNNPATVYKYGKSLCVPASCTVAASTGSLLVANLHFVAACAIAMYTLSKS